MQIAHEIMHAVGYLECLELDRPGRLGKELYFENEPIAELGFSYENAVRSLLPSHHALLSIIDKYRLH
jgi:hypothetical protein